MHLDVEFAIEEDGRCIADVVDLPGAMAYGRTTKEALARAQAVALDVLASDVRGGRRDPLDIMSVIFVPVPHAPAA